MRKKYLYISLSFILLILLISLFISKHIMTYVYVNPYTNTEGLKYISKVISYIDNAARYSTHEANKTPHSNIKFLFNNAYGSGFLNNNPIPNDIDILIGYNLGSFAYDGTNKREIAREIVNKITNLNQNFKYYMSTIEDNGIYPQISYINSLKKNQNLEKTFLNDIELYLDKAISGEKYIKNTKKILLLETVQEEINLPYLMREHELLLTDYKPLVYYSNNVLYNNTLPDYLREVMVVFEYRFNIIQNGKITEIIIVPESTIGVRLQLSRKFFASNIFIGNNSTYFLKNLDIIADDNKYFFYRMHSYTRHLQQVIDENRPLKRFKRLMQTADCIYPAISEDVYNDIQNFVYSNLNSPEIRLLNQYLNIITNLNIVSNSNYLYYKLKGTKELENMNKILIETLLQLEKTKVSKLYIKKQRDFYDKYFSQIVNYKEYNQEEYSAEFASILPDTNNEIVNLTINPEKFDEYINIFEKIYTDAGNTKITVYWLDENIMGILKDSYTETIDDLNAFAKENNFPNVNIKLINKLQIKAKQASYDIWTHYLLTDEESTYANKLRDILLKDKQRFNLKFKFTYY